MDLSLKDSSDPRGSLDHHPAAFLTLSQDVSTSMPLQTRGVGRRSDSHSPTASLPHHFLGENWKSWDISDINGYH